jgi:hypothetical protein
MDTMSNEELLKAIGGLIDQKLEPIKKDISNINQRLTPIEKDTSAVRTEWEDKRNILNDLLTLAKENNQGIKNLKQESEIIKNKVSIHENAIKRKFA